MYVQFYRFDICHSGDNCSISEPLVEIRFTTCRPGVYFNKTSHKGIYSKTTFIVNGSWITTTIYS